jgi:hypothetical protein
MNLNTTDVTAWFRQKAKEFNMIADSLESTFSGTNGEAAPQLVVPASIEVNLEQVKNAVGLKAKRAKEIAAVLSTTRMRVLSVVQANPNDFELIGRGWIKRKM